MDVLRKIVVFVLTLVSTLCASTLSVNGIAPNGPSHGILLDRLKAKQLKIWLAINSRIYAEANDGSFLHPTLKALFETLQNSKHRIFVELDESDQGSRYVAGTFAIERLDPAGLSHVAVIKLRLRNIDRAVAPDSSNVNGRFVPFFGLMKLDRYTEVFAHEMGHAVDVLFDQNRASALDEVSKTTDVIIQEQLRRSKGKSDPRAVLEIRRRDAFLNELEVPAEMVEAEVWRELSVSTKLRQ